MDLSPLLAELEDRFGCTFAGVTSDDQSTEIDGYRTRIRIAPRGADVTITTPLDAAHDGLPAPVLLGLLERNFPNDWMGAALLQSGATAGSLEICECVPARACGETLVPAVRNQHRAAALLTDWIEQALARRSTQGRSG